MIVLVPKPPDVAARPSGYQLHHMAFEMPEAEFEAQRAGLVARGLPAAPR